MASAVAGAMAFTSCSGSKKQADYAGYSSEEEFLASQPVQSAQYRADYFEIGGEKARKGHFDGRVLFAISPEKSGFYVYENGNRTKINYTVMLDRPFEKGDSGIYRSADANGKPVTLRLDSAVFKLAFEKHDNPVVISFEEQPMNVYSSYEAWEKMSEESARRK